MHFFLHLALEGFYTAALREPDAERGLVVHADRRVLDANAPARAKGVAVGMGLPEAKAILEGGKFVTFEPEPYREAQRRWLDRCALVTDVVEPDRLHSAYLDLSLHPDPEALARRLMREIAEDLGVEVRAGMAATRWVAQLASGVLRHPGDPLIAQDLAMREPAIRPAEFLAPFPTRWLLPVEASHRERLEFLGYARIGDVAKVPLDVLIAQFGDAALTIQRAARGGVFQPVRALYPEGALTDRFVFDGPAALFEIVDMGLSRLAARLAKRLEEEDRQGEEVRLWFDGEEGGTVERVRRFAKPLHDMRSLRAAFRAMLPEDLGMQLPAGLRRIRVHLPDLKPMARVQRDLSGEGKGDRERRTEGALAVLRQAFGDRSILKASDLDEPRRIRVLRAWREATGWL